MTGDSLRIRCETTPTTMVTWTLDGTSVPGDEFIDVTTAGTYTCSAADGCGQTLSESSQISRKYKLKPFEFMSSDIIFIIHHHHHHHDKQYQYYYKLFINMHIRGINVSTFILLMSCCSFSYRDDIHFSNFSRFNRWW